jgi:HD-GYP domain-containing protein (c-di-GMP phosphodiesterase class II)
MSEHDAPPGLVRSDASVQLLGRAVVISMHATMQALRIYPVENAAVQKAVDELFRNVQRLLEREGSIDLRAVGDFIYLNDARLRLDLSDYAAFSAIVGALDRHDIGEVEIGPNVQRQDLVPFLALLLEDGPPGDDRCERFQQRLAASVPASIRVEPVRGMEELVDPTEAERQKEAAKLTYFQSVNVAKEVLTDVRLGRAMNLRRVKRAIQTIVDQVLNNETSMLGMTALRDYDEYTFTHCVNVCIISVLIGQRIGLTKAQLYELGMGALFHDIGKQRIDPEVLNKTDALDQAEWQQMKRHPVEGLLTLFSMKGVGEVPYRAMLMAYEHHMKIDQTGYPENIRQRKPTLFSEIVATADGFDAATTKRSYQKQPWPPDEVLREMRENPARGYNPVLVKALINVTGVIPVGTLAILDTFELAVVTARNPDPKRLHQPLVKIISDISGVMLAEPLAVDLSEADPATGKPRRTIVKTTDPDHYGIRVSDYFV